MKKIVCNIEMFDLYQSIQIIDTDTNKVEDVVRVTQNDLKETLALISYQNKIPQIVLHGHPFGEYLAKDIIEYSKSKYGENEINLEIEVKK